MKDALPVNAPTADDDRPSPDPPEAMKGGLAATATDPHDEDAATPRGEQPKA